MRSAWSAALAAALIFSATALAQPKYSGPKPPKQDIPYLVEGDTLVSMDVATATRQERKDDALYTIPGQASIAKTPLASPVFVIDAAKFDVAKLQLFHLEIKNGHREITFRKKGKSGLQPITMSVSLVSGTLYRLEVVPGLENGEYSLSPEGSDQVFCFTVF